MIDLLIKNGAVITMDPERRVIEGCDVAIDQGQVTAVGKGLKVDARKILDAAGCAVCPGFINGHSHVLPVVDRRDWL